MIVGGKLTDNKYSNLQGPVESSHTHTEQYQPKLGIVPL